MTKPRNEVAVGFFVIVGFIFLTLIVFFVSGVYFFRSGYALNVLYDYVSILDKGAPVRMAGVRVGEVSKVDLFFDASRQKTRVKVKLFIEKGVQIRENYLFKIQGTHILSEPHIEISPQPGEAAFLKSETTVAGVETVAIEDLIMEGHDIAKNIAILTGSMKNVMSGSEGDMKQTVTNIKASTDSLTTILNKIEKGEGTAGKLLTQDELYQDARAFVAEIKAHPWRLLKKDNDKKRFLFF